MSTGKPRTSKPRPPSPHKLDTSKLPDQLKELRLPTFRENHPQAADQAAREHWTHTQFLADLVAKECQARQ